MYKMKLTVKQLGRDMLHIFSSEPLPMHLSGIRAFARPNESNQTANIKNRTHHPTVETGNVGTARASALILAALVRGRLRGWARGSLALTLASRDA